MIVDWLTFMDTLKIALAIGIPIGLVSAAVVEAVKKCVGLFGVYLSGNVTGSIAMGLSGVLTWQALMSQGETLETAILVVIVALWTPKMAHDAVKRNEGG